MGAPDLAAARRAAGELVAVGAGRVLLFGSLARGEATERSDIDLVAIYDDRIDALLAGQSAALRDSFSQLAGGDVELPELHIWRPGATYSADRPRSRFDDASLRAYVAATLQIADLAADQCRHQGIAESALVRYERRRNHSQQVLEGPLRHTDSAGSTLEGLA